MYTENAISCEISIVSLYFFFAKEQFKNNYSNKAINIYKM